MNYYQSKFTSIDIDHDKSLVAYYYLSPDHGLVMGEQDFRQGMEAYAQLMEQHRCERLLVDTRLSTFVITPDLQAWVASHIAPRTLSLKKMAFVVSQYIFSQVSLEQMMEEDGIADRYSEPRYFDDLEEANRWLLADWQPQ
jgi:hypothetical protein